MSETGTISKEYLQARKAELEATRNRDMQMVLRLKKSAADLEAGINGIDGGLQTLDALILACDAPADSQSGKDTADG